MKTRPFELSLEENKKHHLRATSSHLRRYKPLLEKVCNETLPAPFISSELKLISDKIPSHQLALSQSPLMIINSDTETSVDQNYEPFAIKKSPGCPQELSPQEGTELHESAWNKTKPILGHRGWQSKSSIKSPGLSIPIKSPSSLFDANEVTKILKSLEQLFKACGMRKPMLDQIPKALKRVEKYVKKSKIKVSQLEETLFHNKTEQEQIDQKTNEEFQGMRHKYHKYKQQFRKLKSETLSNIVENTKKSESLHQNEKELEYLKRKLNDINIAYSREHCELEAARQELSRVTKQFLEIQANAADLTKELDKEKGSHLKVLSQNQEKTRIHKSKCKKLKSTIEYLLEQVRTQKVELQEKKLQFESELAETEYKQGKMQAEVVEELKKKLAQAEMDYSKTLKRCQALESAEHADKLRIKNKTLEYQEALSVLEKLRNLFGVETNLALLSVLTKLEQIIHTLPKLENFVKDLYALLDANIGASDHSGGYDELLKSINKVFNNYSSFKIRLRDLVNAHEEAGDEDLLQRVEALVSGMYEDVVQHYMKVYGLEDVSTLGIHINQQYLFSSEVTSLVESIKRHFRLEGDMTQIDALAFLKAKLYLQNIESSK